MKTRDYDKMYDETTGGTGTHLAVDTKIKLEDAVSYEEGFSSASGVRQETAESGGRIKHPELKDAPKSDRIFNAVEEENAGLADS